MAACVRAVSVAHALPTIGNAKEQGEKDIALVHRVVKRFVNNQFIDSVFGPDNTCMTKERIESWLHAFFGEEEAAALAQSMFLAFDHVYSKRKIEYTKKDNCKKQLSNTLPAAAAL